MVRKKRMDQMKKEEFKSCEQIRVEYLSREAQNSVARQIEFEDYLMVVSNAIQAASERGKTYCIVELPELSVKTGQPIVNNIISLLTQPQRGYSAIVLFTSKKIDAKAEFGELKVIKISGWQPDYEGR